MLVGTRPTRASRSSKPISRSPFALSHNLKTEGYVVESVDRGDEAVRKLAAAPPDLVILDWMSSGMSGPEICTGLRAEGATRMLPIIMLSGRGEEVLRLRGFGAGADDC